MFFLLTRTRSGGREMGISSKLSREAEALLLANPHPKIPRDSFHLAYICYFILGAGITLPWNTFITAIDYFIYLYPGNNINRIFTLADIVISSFCLLLVLSRSQRWTPSVLINAGLVVVVCSLLVVPIMDVVYVRGRRGVMPAYGVTIAVVLVAAVGKIIAECGIMGSAGELPERYMQATGAGISAAGLIVSTMRIATKAIYPHNSQGLRSGANLYFIFSLIFMVMCLVSYNIVAKLPIIQYYKDLKMEAAKQEKTETSGSTTTLWDVVGRLKWIGLGRILILIVTLSIYPGFLTEDMHSQILMDWYPITLIMCFNVSNLVGMSLPAFYLMRNTNAMIGAALVRLLFYPLFLGCFHGPKLLQTEGPVMALTCLFGLSNGYFGNVLLIIGPKVVPLQHSESAALVSLVFSYLGLIIGSIMAWFWLI